MLSQNLGPKEARRSHTSRQAFSGNSLSLLCCRRQEFEGGGKLYVGGLESAEGVVRGFVPMDMIVECRDGRSATYDRHRRPHVLEDPPEGVQKVAHNATRFTKYLQTDGLVDSLRPIMKALKEGASVLVFCMQGKNRSVQTATLLVASAGGCGNWPRAMSHVWLRRKLACYSSLRGPLLATGWCLSVLEIARPAGGPSPPPPPRF